MTIEQVLDQLANDPRWRRNITHWEVIPAQAGRYAPIPDWIEPRLRRALRARGIEQLYSHQAEAIEAVRRGENPVIVTPTASGKTLCYNLPVLDAILKDQNARAIYLFPTKALSWDQLSELQELTSAIDADIRSYTYDGDTPVDARTAIRNLGHVVITNPDMLHTAILPHHPRWARLFSNLRYVVIDEMHQYRGVFGSHVANVLRRLRRVAAFYGASPQFICSSATIANPAELARALTGAEPRVISQNGAPSGERHLVLYNPPLVNRELGIRRSALLEARQLANLFLYHDIQTIVFAPSRVATEVLLTYLQEDAASSGRSPQSVRGYRGGYLPAERREIERGLRDGKIRGVVSTNALELGIDIGHLDAAVLTGYPGTIASTWQQAGRAGRHSGTSVAVLVASSNPLDQYIVNHPDYLLGASPEHGRVNPENFYILMSHLTAAAFELPFTDDEEFGVPSTQEALAYLEEQGLLRHAAGRWYWSAPAYPAADVSLRSASSENFVVVDTTGPSPRVIGEVDRVSAPMLLHEDAIYIHQGQQYHVDRLDYEEKKAYVHKVDVDYYTDADLSVDIQVLDVLKSDASPALPRAFGEVKVSSLVTLFKKIKLYTHENVGSGPVHLPEEQMHTQSYWVEFPTPVCAGLGQEELTAGLGGIAYLLANLAPLYVMCDRRDLQAVPQVRSPFTAVPTVFLYDHYPGGIGLSERLYDLHDELLHGALAAVESCPCSDGCPSCVGPPQEVGHAAKVAALQLLRRAVGAQT